MTKIFPNLVKTINLQIQESQRTSSSGWRGTGKKTTAGPIIIQLLKTHKSSLKSKNAQRNKHKNDNRLLVGNDPTQKENEATALLKETKVHLKFNTQ